MPALRKYVICYIFVFIGALEKLLVNRLILLEKSGMDLKNKTNASHRKKIGFTIREVVTIINLIYPVWFSFLKQNTENIQGFFDTNLSVQDRGCVLPPLETGCKTVFFRTRSCVCQV